MTYTIRCIKSWGSLVQEIENNEKENEQWIYRVMASSCWGLETSLERVCKDSSIQLTEAPVVERKFLREFQRRFQQYSECAPDKDNVLEWLSLIQHYRGPTRLLDFTYSFFVAAYFAFESPKTENVAIWSLQWHKKEDMAFVEAMRRQDPQLASVALQLHQPEKRNEAFNRLFLRENGISFVRPSNPFRLNERLTLQQGIFMTPGDVSKPFMENLIEYQAMLSGANQPPLSIFKYVIPREERMRALLYLNRMNVNNATLFPGLEGFARSLSTNLRLMLG